MVSSESGYEIIPNIETFQRSITIIIFIIIIDLFNVGNIQSSYKTRANSGLLSKKVKFLKRKKRNQIENSYLQMHFYNVFHIYNVLFKGIYKAVK